MDKIIKVKVCGLDSPIPVDLSMMEKSPFLEGAIVLKKLFNISTDEKFKKIFKTDGNHGILLEGYEIFYSDWLSLQRFIRSGILPTKIEKIERLALTAEKLGGIPHLDDVLKKLSQVDKSVVTETPKEDVDNQFDWGFWDRGTGSQTFQNLLMGVYKVKDGWNVASFSEDGIWFKRLKHLQTE